MYGAFLSFRKQITIVTNIFILGAVLAHYFYMQPVISNKFGSLKKACPREKTSTFMPCAADAMFSDCRATLENHVGTQFRSFI